MQFGLGGPLLKRLAGRASALDMGRLTGLTLLLSGVSLGALFVNGLEDQARFRNLQSQQLTIDTVTTADALGPAGYVVLAPGARLDDGVRRLLDQGTPDGGAIFLIDADRQSYRVQGADLGLTLRDLDRVGKQAAGMELLLDDGRQAAIVSRALPSGQTLLAVQPSSVLHLRIWAPYAATAVSIIALAAAFLALAWQFRKRQAAADGERELVKRRLIAPEAAGCGTWSADAHMIELPGALRAALGYRRSPVSLKHADFKPNVHPDDYAALLSLLLGTTDQSETVCRLRDREGNWESVYFECLWAGSRRKGFAIPVGAGAFDNTNAREELNRLQETLGAIPQPFTLWDATGRLLAANTAFAELFGLTEDLDDLKDITVRELAKRIEIDTRFLYDYFAPSATGSLETEGLFPQDRFLRVVRRRTVENGWVCVGNDITDAHAEAEQRARNERELQTTVEYLKKSRRDLREAMQRYEEEKLRAEEANRAKSEFLANMSHELRTPLNAINGFSELMKEELYGPLGHEKYAEYIQDIHSSGSHLLALIDDILDLSKIEAGKLEMRPSQFELERVLREGLRFIETQMRESSLNLTAMIDHLPTVWADQRAVKQVFINLLSNAEKFTPQGGTVSVTTIVDLTSVTVLVADTGIGMTDDQLTRLGAPFELVEDHFSRTRRGTGLGMALSKSLMEAQGGLLAVASQPGAGTVAAFTLPRRENVQVALPSMLKDRARVLTRQAADQPSAALGGLPAVAAASVNPAHTPQNGGRTPDAQSLRARRAGPRSAAATRRR
jgi:two-component system cell cycle sensor histidine kinase PleC